MSVEPFEVRGEWWLPGSTKRVPGALAFSPTSGARLSLIGALRGFLESGEASTVDGETRIEFTDESIARSGVYPRIYGEAEGILWTLEDALRTNHHNMFGTAELETIRADRVFKRILFAENSPVHATAITVGLEHLAAWTLETGLGQRMKFGDDMIPVDGEPWATLTATPIPERSARVSDDFTLKLLQTLNVSGDRVTDVALRQDFYFRVNAAHLVDAGELLDWAAALQDAVSMGVDRTAGFEALTFRHPEAVHTAGDRVIEIPIELFAQWTTDEHDAAGSGSVRRDRMVFTLPELGGLPGLARWLDVTAPHRSAIRRVLLTRARRGLFTSDLLSNRAAALEAFDRTVTGYENTKFKGRLGRCIDLAGEPFEATIGDRPRWLEAMRRERDAIAHHYSGRLAGGAAQHYLAESAYWLFVLCIMRLVALPDEVFTRLRDDQRLTRLRRELPATY